MCLCTDSLVNTVFDSNSINILIKYKIKIIKVIFSVFKLVFAICVRV